MKPRFWRFFVTLPLALRSLADHSADSFAVTVSSSGFSPDALNPKEGDVIEFKFSEGSDTLTQSTLDDPCTPSGDIDVHGPDLFTYNVGSNTDDMFFFNRHATTCLDAIFTINVSQGRQSRFQDNAANAAPPDGGPDVSQETTPSNNQPQPQDPNNAASPDSTSPTLSSIIPDDDITVLPAVPTNIKDADATTATISNTASSTTHTFPSPMVTILGVGTFIGTKEDQSTIVDASGMPTTSPTPESTQPSGKSAGHRGKQNLAGIVIGIILGILALITILSTFTVVWLRKRRAILPTSFSTIPKSPSAWQAARVKFAGLFSRALPSFARPDAHTWNHLNETEERRSSSFIVGASRGTSARTFSSEEQIVTRTDSPTMGRRPGSDGSTLVAGVDSNRDVGRRSSSFASLFVEVSESGSVMKEAYRDPSATKPASSGPEPASSPSGHGDVPQIFV